MGTVASNISVLSASLENPSFAELAGVAFVADDGARLNVGPDVEQDFEVTPVEGFAAGQIKGDDVAGGVRFCVDFRGEAAARAAERLAFLPPFAPAADTCARTTVESNI